MKRVLGILFGLLLISFHSESQNIEIKTLENVILSNGKLQRIDSFPSKYIKTRPIDIWVPENYSEEKKYAVLYMHDGQMLFDSTTTWNRQEWLVDEHASKLMNARETKDFIVVAPWNISEIRHSDYFPKKPFESLPKKTQDSILMDAKLNNISLTILNSDNYLKFLVEELKSYIDNHFNTLTDMSNTFVMGSSMGGLISMYAICEYPQVFGGAACLSTHWTGTYTNKNNPIPETFLSYMDQHLPDSVNHRLYFDFGTKTLDSLYLPYQERVSAILKNHGYETNLRFEDHDHSENSWNKRLDIPLNFLLHN